LKLREHNITLQGEGLVLRPMTEADWDILLKWNSDPEVLYYSEGGNITSWSLEDIQDIYRGVSQNAFCFMIEVGGIPIGKCWLQRMNLDRILEKYPKADCRRIDLMIGEKSLWGQGLGTEAIRLLTELAFEREKADMVFGCDVADYNPASQKAFQKNGYQIDARIIQPAGDKAKECYDLKKVNPLYSRQNEM
jgi:RimJ/RimL family protein N-acetyltransferase